MEQGHSSRNGAADEGNSPKLKERDPLSVRNKSPKKLSNLLAMYGLYKRNRSPTTLFRAVIIALRLCLVESDLDQLEPVGEKVEMESVEHLRQLTRRIQRSVRIIGFKRVRGPPSEWSLTWYEYEMEAPAHPPLYLVQEGTGYVPLQWKEVKDGVTVGAKTYNPVELYTNESEVNETPQKEINRIQEEEALDTAGGDLLPSAEDLKCETDQAVIQLWIQQFIDRLQEAKILCEKQKNVIRLTSPSGIILQKNNREVQEKFDTLKED
ncbi:hypothetical protein PROFUN_07948 [Planoprotostelium fungivorum]|uniref:Uncharacterized protein n=1 Tax=Planoprotostelium fungivorum TaxID=1890364 RepID=A0A2P6NL92_9EUKA|nr:hypothetical protein PROFUN_07948 [Planoprotostelium fungivorum]